MLLEKLPCVIFRPEAAATASYININLLLLEYKKRDNKCNQFLFI